MKKNEDEVYVLCPFCGAEIKASAKSCPHCGSDETTGWSDGAEFSGDELPDYDEIVENEFGTDVNGNKTKKANPFVIVAALIVALAFIASMIL